MARPAAAAECPGTVDRRDAATRLALHPRFRLTVPEGLSAALVDAIANVIPLSLLAAAVHDILKWHVMARPVPVQALCHVGLAIGFSTTWYALVLVMLAALAGFETGDFALCGFSGPALTWQAFQGLVLYATVAGLCYAVRGGREAANVTIVAAPAPLERYLTRLGDEVVPVRVADIVTIAGAQDYAEVTTITGVHLVRMSLGEFERRLGQNFSGSTARRSLTSITSVGQSRRAWACS